MAEVRKMSEFNFNEESNHPNIILRDMRDERNDVKGVISAGGREQQTRESTSFALADMWAGVTGGGESLRQL